MIQKLKNILQFDLFLLVRFVACILVIRQHVNFSYPNVNLFGYNIGWFLGGNNSSGGYAVIVFFVLSGYLMSKIFLTNRYSFDFKGILRFWVARLKRIAPLYYLINIIGLWFLFYYLLTPGWQNLKRLIQLTFFAYDQSFVFNQVTWTITLEMIYYLICPFVIYFIYQFRQNWLFLGLFVFTSLALIVYPVRFTDFSILNAFLANLGYFLFGSILYPIVAKSIWITNHKVPYVSFIAFILLITCIMVPWENFPTINSGLILAILTSIFIFLRETNDAYQTSSTFGSKIDQLGLLSYSVYLIHMLILIRFNDLYRAMLDAKFGEVKSGFIVLILVSLLSILISILLVKVDKNLSKWLESKLKILFRLN